MRARASEWLGQEFGEIRGNQRLKRVGSRPVGNGIGLNLPIEEVKRVTAKKGDRVLDGDCESVLFGVQSEIQWAVSGVDNVHVTPAASVAVPVPTAAEKKPEMMRGVVGSGPVAQVAVRVAHELLGLEEMIPTLRSLSACEVSYESADMSMSNVLLSTNPFSVLHHEQDFVCCSSLQMVRTVSGLEDHLLVMNKADPTRKKPPDHGGGPLKLTEEGGEREPQYIFPRDKKKPRKSVSPSKKESLASSAASETEDCRT